METRNKPKRLDGVDELYVGINLTSWKQRSTGAEWIGKEIRLFPVRVSERCGTLRLKRLDDASVEGVILH